MFTFLNKNQCKKNVRKYIRMIKWNIDYPLIIHPPASNNLPNVTIVTYFILHARLK